MEAKKCSKCGKGILTKVPIPMSLIKSGEKDKYKNKTGWRCRSCGGWSFDAS